MAYQAYDPGGKPAGFQVYDISKPAEPREITFYDLSGADDHSVGVHYVSFMDGRYAHLCASHPDFVPNHKDDNQFYMIVDLANPSQPTEVGRWWLPGQRQGDKEPPLEHHVAPSLHFGMRPHHTLCYPERPDRAYIGYIDAGIVILDIADKAHPKLVSRLDYHPPFPGFTHTVLPLFERDLLVVTDEATGDQGLDWPKRCWIVDARLETNPVMISSLPTPQNFGELHKVGGRIGAHNIHENEPEPGQREAAEHGGLDVVQCRRARLRYRRPVPAGGDRGLPAGDADRPARLPHQRRVRRRPADHLRRRPRERRALRAGVFGQETVELR